MARPGSVRDQRRRDRVPRHAIRPPPLFLDLFQCFASCRHRSSRRDHFRPTDGLPLVPLGLGYGRSLVAAFLGPFPSAQHPQAAGLLLGLEPFQGGTHLGRSHHGVAGLAALVFDSPLRLLHAASR